MRRGHDEQGVAVRCGLGGLRGADDARRARPVLDEERLLEPLAELLRDIAADQIGRASGAERHDHAHRALRPLSRRLGGGGQGGGRKDRDRHTEATHEIDRAHGVLPQAGRAASSRRCLAA